MIDLYLIRHGRTLFNEKNLVQGLADSPLTKEGIDQAIQVGKNLMDISFDTAYTSPSLRAWDTCLYALNGRDIPVHLDRRLLEMSFGTLEGESNERLMDGKPKGHYNVIEIGWKDIGGEDEAMVVRRIASFLEELYEKENGHTILLASHGTYLSILISYLLKDRTQKFFMQNCAITHLQLTRDTCKLIAFNDTSYRDERKV